MNMWKNANRLLPSNREGKWPLPVQLGAFALIEVLFVWTSGQLTEMVYASPLSSWILGDGTEPLRQVLPVLLTTLLWTWLCAWRIGLQRDVTFGGGVPSRWTVIPWAMGAGALNLLASLLPLALADVLPRLTDSLMVCTALRWVAYAALACLSCLLLKRLREGERARAVLPGAAVAALAVLLILCSVWAWQAENTLLQEAVMAAETQPAVVRTFGSVTEITEDELSALLAASGLEGRVTVATPGMSLEPPADPFAGLEAVTQSAARLSDGMMWAMRIPLFFAMKNWLFAKKEDAARV